MTTPIWNFEQDPSGEPMDETGINLRHYFDTIPDEKLRQYSSSWTDDHVMDWDGNFKDDGTLFLICCERDVDMEEYRRVLEHCIQYRDRVRPTLQPNS